MKIFLAALIALALISHPLVAEAKTIKKIKKAPRKSVCGLIIHRNISALPCAVQA